MAGDYVDLSSGREIYANNGIIGISPNLSIAGGYDDMITLMPDRYRDEPEWSGLSPQDICELADIAIERWQRLKVLVACSS